MTEWSENALLSDSYEFAMLQAYLEHEMERTAVFEFFVRRLPSSRNFLVAAGLEQLVTYLEGFHFGPDELEWLSRSGYNRKTIDYLRELRFEGDLDAMPEGTVFFPNEPVVQISAPLPQAQLIETRLINTIHFQSIIASKAVRATLAAPDKLLVDFGARRAHGGEAALLAARASYIAGFSGSSLALAGKVFGIPVFGTMAHSFIQAHRSESLAFENFADSMPHNIVLLLDTYDTERAAEKVARLAPMLARKGRRVSGVRLDSGNLAQHARKVRAILDAQGLQSIRIFASGGVDERSIENLLASGAPIDGFGVGTLMTTSADAPYLDSAYKIQEYDGQATRKRSEGKATWPGAKQVYRIAPARDYVSLRAAPHSPMDGVPLLEPVMRRGKRVAPPVPLNESRQRLREELERLPDALRSLESTRRTPYAVTIAPEILELAARLDASEASGARSLLRLENETGYPHMKRTATAIWKNGGKTGEGSLSTESGALSNASYSFLTRFENKVGTNPEELVAAAHAGCFSMALSSELEKASFKSDEIMTHATVILEKTSSGWSITRVDLDVTARVQGVEYEQFLKLAEDAKSNCPISRLLRAEITLKCQLSAELGVA
ncbi:MAG: nicotinate phosphoribosyltransferase [Bdellovibrionales bacterium RIFOXYC1_FULL_54_43]|nr:MAG: nicotinate phosphoribosyltransferase [Bdellovibrionales bacterium RIFOXYC1_FULL_54_43]OFZ85391.1 MAG: nicotinate phosphoribosyltransferase [Bdellovibrionales bacterium RIFOXYD1_FULL_55_31]